MANQTIIENKKKIVSEIAENIKSSSSVVFFDYRGLSDENISELRKKLRDSSSSMKVYKNTLTERALKDLNLTMDECVVGPSAVVFGTDAISPIKILTEYAKTHEVLNIKGGIVDGEVTSLEKLAKLATIPSREVMLNMLASGMISYVRDLSIALDLYAKENK